jgi:hypothetical protein
MAEFKVGGKCMAIKNAGTGIFKKGEVFEIEAIRELCCGKGGLLLTLKGIGCVTTCTECYLQGRWLRSRNFVPLDDTVELSDFTADELIKQLEPQIQVC